MVIIIISLPFTNSSHIPNPTMSWFAKSLATTLNLDDNHNDSNRPDPTTESPTHPDDSSNRGGVKEDFSELTKTLTRNFWGVASFLAPPPPSSSDSDPSGSDPDESDSPLIPNIRNDFAEIGGKFRSGISKISTNMAVVSEITTKMASNFLQLGGENQEDDRDYYEFGAVVGVTDRVVEFVRDVVMHPETWLDFPLPENDDQEGDFAFSITFAYFAYFTALNVCLVWLIKTEIYCIEFMFTFCLLYRVETNLLVKFI